MYVLFVVLLLRHAFILITTRFVYVPTAEKDFVSPDHGQREQVIQLLRWEVLDVPQDEFPSRLPVFVTFPVTPMSLDLGGEGSVLLNKIVHV